MTIKYMQKKKIDNRRVSRRIDHGNWRILLVYCLLGMLVVLALSFNGWVKWKQTEIEFKINKEKQKRAKLLGERKQLTARKNHLRSYGRADDIARKKLGMKDILPEQQVIVRSDKQLKQSSSRMDEAMGGNGGRDK